MVLATAGSVGTGSVDPINDIADICGREGLWLHVDGAYGAMAAAIPDAEPDLKALHRADSLALDPHKWSYSPLVNFRTTPRDVHLLPGIVARWGRALDQQLRPPHSDSSRSGPPT